MNKVVKFPHNLLVLRKKDFLTQSELSEILGVKNTTISGYEKGSSNPEMATFLKISDYFCIDLHSLMYADLEVILSKTKVKEDVMKDTAPTFKALPQTSKQIYGDNVKPLAKKGHELAVLNEPPTDAYSGKTLTIPILDAKAAAALPYSLDNSAFWTKLPTITLPFHWLVSGDYALIQIDKDTMEPTIYKGDWVYIRKLEKMDEINDGYVHVVITTKDIACKRLINRASKGYLILQSDNKAYSTNTIKMEDVLQIWKVEMKMSAILHNENMDINKRLIDIEADIAEIRHDLKATKKS